VSVRDFYDGLAADYHLVYGDDWDAAVERQGGALDGLIRRLHGDEPVDVLDCTCGIGTQAIGLARRGHRVRGTDLSRRAIERARREAARLGADVAFEVADVRDLSTVPGDVDVVLSCDNALPHLLTDAELLAALRSMRGRLRAGGLLVVSTRDYDRALVERPALAPPSLVAGPPRRIVSRLHDWDAPDSPCYTVHLFVLTETDAGWALDHHRARYRAVPRAALRRAAEEAGFAAATWHGAEDVGYFQPVMTASAPQ
jgi:SAM-dependent methyltransferase